MGACASTSGGEIFGSALAYAKTNVLARLPFRGRRDLVLTTTLQPCLQCAGAIRLGPVATVRFAGPDRYWDGCHDFGKLSAREANRTQPARIGLIAVSLVKGSDPRGHSAVYRAAHPGRGRSSTCHDCGQDPAVLMRADKRGQVPRKPGDLISLPVCILNPPIIGHDRSLRHDPSGCRWRKSAWRSDGHIATTSCRVGPGN